MGEGRRRRGAACHWRAGGGGTVKRLSPARRVAHLAARVCETRASCVRVAGERLGYGGARSAPRRHAVGWNEHKIPVSGM